VLVEKPLAPSLDAGRRIVKAAADARITLMPGHIERFNPAIQELVRRVRGGGAGRVLQMTARRTSAMRVPPADVNVVHDSALHDIDAMRFVLGAEVREVYASGLGGIVADGENAILAQLKFEPENGLVALGNLEVNWLSPRRLRDLAVLCEKGLFVVDYALQTLDFYPAPQGRSGPVQGWEASRASGASEVEHIFVEPQEQLALEIGAFVSAVREGRAPQVKPEDGLAALAIADAVTESARSGRVVRPAPWSLDD
jgi:predicted dehydrogenase